VASALASLQWEAVLPPLEAGAILPAMPIHDLPLVLRHLRHLSPTQFVLELDGAEIAADCSAGQFVMTTVGEDGAPLLRRPMAIYRIRRDDAGQVTGFSILVEVVGLGTGMLQQRQPGDILHVLGPLGTAFQMPAPGVPASEHLLVMGGVGAAPFPLLAERLLAEGHVVRAFIGARTAELLLCVEDFEELGVPVELSTDDGTRGYHGLVTDTLDRHLRQRGEGPATLYACGPVPMMRAVDQIARRDDLPLQVSFEAPMACGLGACLSCVIKLRDGEGWSYRRVCKEGPVFDSREVIWE
jgi:dihydroorotate dehydrogenase electron transfer subunit